MKGVEKTIRKNPIQTIKKIVKTEMKLPHENKKSPREKTKISSNNVFSLSFKTRVKKIHVAKNNSTFRSTSCFGVTKITTPI